MNSVKTSNTKKEKVCGYCGYQYSRLPFLILPIDSGCGWNYWNDTGERVYIEVHKQPYKVMDIRKKDIQLKIKDDQLRVKDGGNK